jgi:DinB superfamily
MDRVISEFRETINRATQRLLSISDEQSQQAAEEGKWSPKQIIGHLIDSASNNHQRFVRAQFKDDLVFQGYDQEGWVRVQRYDEESWPMLVQLWSAYNLHLAHIMAHASEENRTRLRHEHNLDQIAWQTVDVDEPVTLEYFMRDYIGHLENHLRQVLDAVEH